MSRFKESAILGGVPVSDKSFAFNRSIGFEEKQAALRVLESGELSGFIASPGEPFWGGREVRALEGMFELHYGVRHALAFNSATTALHAAVAATGVGPGDEVIVSPYTMTATATAILMTGAVPVFADIEERTFGLDPDSVRANITPYTRGIMAVNLFGHPARLGPLRKIADEGNFFLIEDNSQAPDALYDGRPAGTIGDIGIFSFNRHKVMQSGEGGVLITNNDDFATKGALVRNHGEVVVEPMGISDIVNTVGLNYRMTEIEAAIAQEQFRKMPNMNSQRINLANRLTEGLRLIDGLEPPAQESGCRHVYYMYPILFDEEKVGMPRDLFTKAIVAEGFYLRSGYLRPVYLEPVYQRKLCFGYNGFPFSANPRNAELNYSAGICPTVERLQKDSMMVTPIMQPPQTLADMDNFIEACKKTIHNREKLLAAWNRQTI